MPRTIRYQYPRAVYHLMARGDGGKLVFENDEDRKAFLFRLGKVCECHGWLVHAWVLMGNHFHLLVETPEANLAVGMKLLLGSFSQGWNRRRGRRGHVFQGRYKSIPVNASDSDPRSVRHGCRCKSGKVVEKPISDKGGGYSSWVCHCGIERRANFRACYATRYALAADPLWISFDGFFNT
jgi:REP element-mobilizing transposase RayT